MEDKVIIRLTFNPGLALTGFHTILPCFHQVNQTWAHDHAQDQYLVSGQLKKKHLASMSCELEPTIWSSETDQQIPCFDRRQLIITWMSNIKEVHSKPRPHVSLNPLFGVWPTCYETPSQSPSSVRTHEQYNHEKINSWVSFCFPYEYGAPLGGPSGHRSSAINTLVSTVTLRKQSWMVIEWDKNCTFITWLKHAGVHVELPDAVNVMIHLLWAKQVFH